MKKTLTLLAFVLALGTMGCEIRTYPEHSKPVFVVAESQPSPTYVVTSDYYEFENQFGEFCYGERDYDLYGTCYTEWCFETWFNTGWYHWDTFCI